MVLTHISISKSLVRAHNYMYNNICKHRMDKTADEVKYSVLSCSCSTILVWNEIGRHLSDLDWYIGTILLEKSLGSDYLSFAQWPASFYPGPFCFCP